MKLRNYQLEECTCNTNGLVDKYRFKGKIICSVCAENEQKNIKFLSSIMIGFTLLFGVSIITFFVREYVNDRDGSMSVLGGALGMIAICIGTIFKVRRLKQLDNPVKIEQNESMAENVQHISGA